VGLDDIALAAYGRINLTTIHLQKRAMGVTAAELLMKRVRAKRRGQSRIMTFPTHLVVRGTTAPPAKAPKPRS
jgi:LacI family transcriptional regulator